ncbi:MAG TPA: protein kinase [Blastocatellia bacterium]|nr:protein kinase [Blastocatellia bacterium]
MRFCVRCGAPLEPEDLFCGECGTRQPGGIGRSRPPVAGPEPVAASMAQLPPGTLLQNRYEIIRRIGGGGMGNVYQAYDRNLGDALRAVKEMMEMFSDPALREKSIEDFRREATLLASLKHPSIPIIYDHFVEGGRYYLVMEYISGGDLATRQKLVGGKFDEVTVTMWAIQICDVLDYLHHRQPPIIYRDLKPANLMIDPESNRVMLIDFGIARRVGPQQKGVTAVGTMGYAPPELFSGQVEPRSDLYSLGATMFHFLTGVDPRDKPLLIFDFTKNPTPRQLNPDITPQMEQILMRAVEYSPANRFASAQEMKRALEDHLRFLQQARGERFEAARQEAFGDLVRIGGGEMGHTSHRTEKVFCSQCGVPIGFDDLYCASCGARQPLEIEPLRSTAALLVLSPDGSEVRDRYTLSKESNLIGRTDPISGVFPEVDLSRHDPQAKVSRRHARIWRENDRYLVEDLRSVNGTLLNETILLTPQTPYPLRDGDLLRLGEVRLLFRAG